MLVGPRHQRQPLTSSHSVLLLRDVLPMQFYNMYLRVMGSKVGEGVSCMGAVAAEYEQVKIGAGSVINDGSFLLTHTVENRKAKIRPVTIGQHVTIGALCAVLPDATMGDGATLADMSLVSGGGYDLGFDSNQGPRLVG